VATEIERKFLVRELPDLSGAEGEPMVQGYLRADAGGSVRLRITGSGAILNVKGPSQGSRRLEFEYPVPVADARQMLDALAVGHPVEKIRYRLDHGGHTWELDVFSGHNEGLVIAEVELDDADQAPSVPAWGAGEVTDDERFYNAYLARRPFQEWPDRASFRSAAADPRR